MAGGCGSSSSSSCAAIDLVVGPVVHLCDRVDGCFCGHVPFPLFPEPVHDAQPDNLSPESCAQDGPRAVPERVGHCDRVPGPEFRPPKLMSFAEDGEHHSAAVVVAGRRDLNGGRMYIRYT